MVSLAHLSGVTVSMRVMSAGDGYKYLLQPVAAGDGHRSLTTPLARHYAETGCPPGYWIGTYGLGTRDRRIEPGGVVSEEQLKRLLGQGRDPVTGEPLGQAYSKFKTVQEPITERIEKLDRGLSADERATADPTYGAVLWVIWRSRRLNVAT